MIGKKDFFSLYDDLEHIKNIMDVPYSETLTTNSFSYDESTKIITVDVDSGQTGQAQFLLKDTNVGDLVEVECEIYSLTGANPHIRVTEFEAGVGNATAINSDVLEKGVWVTKKLNYFIQNDTYDASAIVYVGLGDPDVGSFMMKNVRLNLVRKKELPPIEKNKIYAIQNTSGVFDFKTDFVNSVGTITNLGFAIKVTFDKPLDGKYPIAFCGSSGVHSGYNYLPVTTEVKNGFVTIRFTDLTTNTLISDVTTLPDNYTFFVKVESV